VFGVHGGGVAEHFGLADRVDFHVGTLSKAVGTHGGFIATSAERRQWLLNTARSYVFTTALPLPIVSATRAALKAATPALRSRLWPNVTQLTEGLSLSDQNPIVPVLLKDEADTLESAGVLFEQGFHVGAIRPPTVPHGTSRLRITLSAAHESETITRLKDVLKDMI
jgi:8-amino-7-oxononanoate synthase